MTNSRKCCLLMDNGSLRPAATLGLRALAAALSTRLERDVEPVSLLHSSAVPASALDGRPAEILEPALLARYAAGFRAFTILPLFFGPSGALISYLPERLAALAADRAGWQVSIAPPACGAGPEPDIRLARILAHQVRRATSRLSDPHPPVILVDHGSPQRAVAEVRNRIAGQLAGELRRDPASVRPASMERREGAAFEFNEPLLERALDAVAREAGSRRDIVVAPLFFLPGRHAGPGGDIETICRAAEKRHPGLRVHLADLVGEHPLLLDLLVDRFYEARKPPS